MDRLLARATNKGRHGTPALQSALKLSNTLRLTTRNLNIPTPGAYALKAATVSCAFPLQKLCQTVLVRGDRGGGLFTSAPTPAYSVLLVHPLRTQR